jgi:hypothetical protein
VIEGQVPGGRPVVRREIGHGQEWVDSSPCQQPKAERSELERYLLPLLRCHPDVVSAWRSAESTGRYCNAAIKGSYDCRAAQSNEALGFK